LTSIISWDFAVNATFVCGQTPFAVVDMPKTEFQPKVNPTKAIL